LDADHPENGVLIPRLNTALVTILLFCARYFDSPDWDGVRTNFAKRLP
jgi:hypothetical protein